MYPVYICIFLYESVDEYTAAILETICVKKKKINKKKKKNKTIGVSNTWNLLFANKRALACVKIITLQGIDFQIVYCICKQDLTLDSHQGLRCH